MAVRKQFSNLLWKSDMEYNNLVNQRIELDYGRYKAGENMHGKKKDDQSCKIFFWFGFCFLFSECIKQILLITVVHNGSYSWRYFPFQLCSLPMYLCLILPFLKHKKAVIHFFMDINLLGGICAFADTSGMSYPLLILTLHSVCWHLALIALGIYTGIRFSTGLRIRDYLGVIKIFVITAGIAEIINTAVSKLFTTEIDMFYINPYRQFSQIIIRNLNGFLPNILVILVYVAAIILGGFLIHLIWMALAIRRTRNLQQEVV